jgi:hypothetical protein
MDVFENIYIYIIQVDVVIATHINISADGPDQSSKTSLQILTVSEFYFILM